MKGTETGHAAECFRAEAAQIVESRLETVASVVGRQLPAEQLKPGKMLRTRLAGRLQVGGANRAGEGALLRCCAAIELVHTASLLHDDVVDNAIVRRGRATSWRVAGRSFSVLAGDLLLCEALELVRTTADGRYLEPFVAKLREVCASEARQEMKLRGREADERRCLEVARGKTGPLFAFVALVAGGEDRILTSALEEAGYRIGCAYQLADDLLDATGREEVARKTLGTDHSRRKPTLMDLPGGRELVRSHLRGLCRGARQCLGPWQAAGRAVARYLQYDLEPVLRRFDAELDTGVADEL